MRGDDVEQALRGILADRPETLIAVYLFGSRARGTATDRSDVDLAMLYGEKASPPVLRY